MRLALSFLAAGVMLAADSLASLWLLGPRGASSSKSMPEVHSVSVAESEVLVRSAGVSTHYLGPLQTPAWPVEQLRQFDFRFPRVPGPVEGGAPLPARVLGAFANGVPIYNHMEAASYQGRNLWHFDTIARARRDPAHAPAPGLLEGLVTEGQRHSPIIGFALDGYPVYGPWGFTDDGTLARMRSSYRLRKLSQRDSWPEGLALTPGQWGPAIGKEYPLGTFAEDYEFAPGTGDLDACNGRFGRTPEYPGGTYAYFLATDARGDLAYPYLIGRCLHGRTTAQDPAPSRGSGISFLRTGNTLRFRIADANGRAIRNLEYVHERPFHLLAVSEDLRDFDHLHPELADDGAWQVEYRFPRPGRYFLYCDFTPPGSGQRVEKIEVDFDSAAPLAARAAKRFDIRMEPAALRAGEDLELRFRLPAGPWRPYLGAWGHFVLIAEGHRSFVHAHPAEDTGGRLEPAGFHVHGVSDAPAGPMPEVIRVPVNFAEPGRYRLWAQFQAGEEVVVAPFDLEVAAGARRSDAGIPGDAIRVRITSSGYQPARVELPAGKPATMAFLRDGSSNCGGSVVIPSLGIERRIAPGGAALVTIPAGSARELRFQCGMGMYRGAIVVR